MRDNSLAFTIMWILFVFAMAYVLSGCTTRTIYVPASCPKPQMPAPPHDYLKDLNMNASAPEFVKACLATKISAFQAYDSCQHVLKSYR